jgi:hypothetical protein
MRIEGAALGGRRRGRSGRIGRCGRRGKRARKIAETAHKQPAAIDAACVSTQVDHGASLIARSEGAACAGRRSAERTLRSRRSLSRPASQIVSNPQDRILKILSFRACFGTLSGLFRSDFQPEGRATKTCVATQTAAERNADSGSAPILDGSNPMASLFERYRPRTWNEVVGQDKLVAKVNALRPRGLGGRAYWIAGPSGRCRIGDEGVQTFLDLLNWELGSRGWVRESHAC